MGRTFLAFLTLCLLITSCTTIRSTVVRPAPENDVYLARTMDGYDYYWYYSKADLLHPLKSKSSEDVRLKRFKKWLSRNGYENSEFEIISRKVMPVDEKLGTKVYEITYLIKVRSPQPKGR